MKINKLLTALLLTLALTLCAAAAGSENEMISVGRAESLTDGIIAYNLLRTGSNTLQEWIDSELAQNAGISSEWYVFALSRIENCDTSAYRTALEDYLGRTAVYSASTMEKYALLLALTGGDGEYVVSVTEEYIGKQGIMSLVYGLHLLNNGYICSNETVSSVTEKILAMQLDDGGWALNGSAGDVDVTAMTVQALAALYGDGGDIDAAVDSALELLSKRQLEDGDFSSYGRPNAESTAQVITALCSLGIDGETDPRFIKNENTLFDGLEKYRLGDGSFCHTVGGDSDGNATVQAYAAAAAYRLCAEGSSLYIFNVPTPEPPLQANTVQTSAPTETDAVTAPKGAASEPKKDATIGYKPIAALCVVGAALVVSAVFFAVGRKNRKNFIAVAVISAMLIGVIFVTDITPADEFYGATETKKDPIGRIVLTVNCRAALGRIESEYMPEDGMIIDSMSLEIEQGDSVYDVLVEAVRKLSIHMETDGSGSMAYVSGINYLYEYQCGDLSGWIYRVNGEQPSVSCGTYILSDGDRVEWVYTCEMGRDPE